MADVKVLGSRKLEYNNDDEAVGKSVSDYRSPMAPDVDREGNIILFISQILKSSYIDQTRFLCSKRKI